MNEELTLSKALFIEQKVKEYLDYTITCLDRAQAEGTTVLQWFFGVIVGSLGLIGSLAPNKYWSFAGGFFVAALWAAYSAMRLIKGLRSRDTMPPGNFCDSLNTLLDEPEHRMRWREARGVDGRIRKNTDAVQKLAECVDRARDRFVILPAWFFGGIVIAWLTQKLCETNPSLIRWITGAGV
jgi:hypothetical protein